MKLYLVITLFICVSSIDVCRQMLSYETCIASTKEQCRWQTQFQQCQYSNNYLFGCDSSLNKNLCVKQLGLITGELAICEFKNKCQQVTDNYNSKCSDSLTKAGCLAITNPQQMCQWINSACTLISDLTTVQTNFGAMKLSASVCPRIQGYLMVHYQLLWKLTSYIPDLIGQADLQVNIEAGIANATTISYSSQTTLANNYLNQDGTFNWYDTSSIDIGQSSGSQIGDTTREGCIAVEITSLSQYKLIFSQISDVLGVNHIFCKYMATNTFNQQPAIFINNQCTILNSLNLLQDQNFIDTNQVTCTSMERSQCSKFRHPTIKCQPALSTQQYTCVTSTKTTFATTCPLGVQSLTYQDCQGTTDLCQLDTNTATCTNLCSTYVNQAQCAQDPSCSWKGIYRNSDSSEGSQGYFITCTPVAGCTQLGVSKLYCQKMVDFCVWVNNSCQYISDISTDYFQPIDILKCADITNVFACSAVTLQNQYCLWYNNACINVKDQQVYSYYYNFPKNSLMNRNLCVSQTQNIFKYDYQQKTCIDVPSANIKCMLDMSDVDLKCSNPDAQNINRQLCLSLLPSLTQWDQNQQVCNNISKATISSKGCDQLFLVNQNVCQIATPAAGQICLYNQVTQNCYSAPNTNLVCSTPGITRIICLGITTPGQYCQWMFGKCTTLTRNQIIQNKCSALMSVNANACSAYAVDDYCSYDSISANCYPRSKTVTDCKVDYSPSMCQISSASCYYDWVLYQCQPTTATILNNASCTGNYFSSSACKSITSPGQACYFTDTCLAFTPTYQSNCDQYSSMNQLACQKLMTTFSNYFSEKTFCSYTSNTCSSDVTAITDCGTNLAINLPRCSAYTPSAKCYFGQDKCRIVDDTKNLGKLILNSITCQQANLQVCILVTTKTQICKKLVNTSNLNNKCIPMTVTSNTCANLADNSLFDQTLFSVNRCTLATDACYYNPATSNCAAPATSQLCDSTGLSKPSCLSNSNGTCGYQNNQCDFLSFNSSLECASRNPTACLYGNLNCSIQTSVCSLLARGDCPTTIVQGQHSIQYCASVTYSVCWQSLSSCSTTEEVLPCFWRQNILSCQRQGTQLCQWINGKCQDPNMLSCENAQNQSECVKNPGYTNYCVYHNGFCRSLPKTAESKCDINFPVNYSFCKQYPDCVYGTDNYCRNPQPIITVLNQAQTVSSSSDNPIITDCLYDNQYSCTSSNILSLCVWSPSSLTCSTSSGILSCPTEISADLANSVSIYTCSKINCSYYSDYSGFGFCLAAGATCGSIKVKSVCLLDLTTLKCWWDGTLCKDVSTLTTLTCDAIKTTLVSYSICKQISDADSAADCFYNWDSNKCLPSQIQYSDCATAGTSQSRCQLMTNSFCTYTGGTCTAGTAGTFDANLNYYGCMQLTDNNYYFSVLQFTCTLLATDLTHIFECRYLNKNSCLGISDQVGLVCVWDTITSLCRSPIVQETITCENYNKLACLQSELFPCKWDSTCQAVTPSTTCDTTSTFKYSPAVCQASTDSSGCMSSVTACEVISNPAFKCSGLGLNQWACLNLTSELTCQWNGKSCQDANLQFAQCTDTGITQNTCSKILNQTCAWVGSACTLKTGTQCSDFSNLSSGYSCRNTNLVCKYNQNNKQCAPQTFQEVDCIIGLSFLACQQVTQKICTWTQGICQVWQFQQAACSLIINQYGCLNAAIRCYWDTANNLCKDAIVIGTTKLCTELRFNQQACTKLFPSVCQFDSTTNQCTFRMNTYFNNGIPDQSNPLLSTLTQPLLTGICTSFNNESDCIASKFQTCFWNGSICTNFVSTTCPNHNMSACLKVNANCAWRDGSCLLWKISSQLSDLTLVAPGVCQLATIALKYDLANLSCVSVVSDELCSAQGLNQLGCVKLKATCQFSTTCQSFVKSSQTTCADYTFVTASVCQQISGLACKYDSKNYSCVDSNPDSDNCLTVGLSQLGCTQTTAGACYWSKQCLTFKNDPYTNKCTSTYLTNAQACQQIDYFGQPCSYDTINFVCTPVFNRYSRCTLPGLNKYACFEIIREACQFTTSCTSFTATTSYCYQVANVNYLGCSVLTQDTCGYDPLNYNCYSLIGTPPCNLLGLSKVGCTLNSLCIRNDDDNTCIAKQLQYTNQCQLTKDSCIASDVCQFQNNTCVRKYCDHLTLCQGQINGITCYKNSANVCLGATKCEDVVLLNKDQKCEEFFFFAAACVTTTLGCASQSNLALICGFNSSTCGTQCINKNGVCRAPICSDFNQTQCLQQDSCLFQNNTCQQIEACTQVADLDLCSSVIVKNLQCSWQEYKWIDTTMYCTAIWCDLFGSSYTLCNGNEINGKTCLLDQFYQCRSCDLVSDQATCNNSNNACQYVNGSCQSIFCGSFNTESTCGQISRCYWSTQDNVCRKLCVQNIRVEQCDALQYECHWNPYTSTCKQGAEQVPDLSVKIQVQDISSQILYILIMLQFA